MFGCYVYERAADALCVDMLVDTLAIRCCARHYAERCYVDDVDGSYGYARYDADTAINGCHTRWHITLFATRYVIARARAMLYAFDYAFRR